MNWPVFMHAVGIVSLGVMFTVSLWTIVTSIAPQWQRIFNLACGNIEPVFHTLFPEGSAARPPQILRDQLDAEEAEASVRRRFDEECE